MFGEVVEIDAYGSSGQPGMESVTLANIQKSLKQLIGNQSRSVVSNCN
jgi:hypothetical protein